MRKYKELIFETNKGTFIAEVFLCFNPMELHVKARQENLVIGGSKFNFRTNSFRIKRENENIKRIDRIGYNCTMSLMFVIDSKITISNAVDLIIEEIKCRIDNMEQKEIEECE